MINKDNFLGKDWLLNTTEGVKLYHDIAVPLRKEVGIIDTHTHHNLRQIVENKSFPNIWRAEVLETREEYKNCDHYINNNQITDNLSKGIIDLITDLKYIVDCISYDSRSINNYQKHLEYRLINKNNYWKFKVNEKMTFDNEIYENCLVHNIYKIPLILYRRLKKRSEYRQLFALIY